jgi:hypothetical protein
MQIKVFSSVHIVIILYTYLPSFVLSKYINRIGNRAGVLGISYCLLVRPALTLQRPTLAPVPPRDSNAKGQAGPFPRSGHW